VICSIVAFTGVKDDFAKGTASVLGGEPLETGNALCAVKLYLEGELSERMELTCIILPIGRIGAVIIYGETK
jgi:hypothetical protein